MTIDVLQQILAAGGKRKGDAFVFTGLDATLMVDMGGNLAMIEKLRRVELRQDAFVVVETARDERYLIVPEDVCGLKLTGGEGGTGFVA